MLLAENKNFIFEMVSDLKNNAFVFYIRADALPCIEDIFKKISEKYERLYPKALRDAIREELQKAKKSFVPNIPMGLLVVSFLFPKSFLVFTGEICQKCQGIEKDTETFFPYCYSCRGTGKENELETRELKQVLKKVQILFRVLMSVVLQKEITLSISPFREQLALVRMDCDWGEIMSGASLGGDVSHLWIRQIQNIFQKEVQAYEIKNRIFQLYKKMEIDPIYSIWNHGDKITDFDFCLSESGGFVALVPGVNGCTFYQTPGGTALPGEITCHNIDSVFQQFYLLVGFGCLWGVIGNMHSRIPYIL